MLLPNFGNVNGPDVTGQRHSQCRLGRLHQGQKDATYDESPQQSLVGVGREETWVGVSLHQCVYLQLGVVEYAPRRLHHVAVDYVSHLGIEAHLQRTEQH